MRACPGICVSVSFKFNQNKFNNQFLYFLIYLRYNVYRIYLYLFVFALYSIGIRASFFFRFEVLVMRSIYIKRTGKSVMLQFLSDAVSFLDDAVRFSLVLRLYGHRILYMQSLRQTFSRRWTVYTAVSWRAWFSTWFSALLWCVYLRWFLR